MTSVYTDFGIFVIGGILDDFKVTPTCEYYDIEKDVWSEIAPLNKPSMNSAVCVLNKNYLVKFGGKIDEDTLNNTIEIYDILNDIWNILEYQHSIPIPSQACCIQIDKQKILLYGGTYEKFKDKTDSIFIFEFDEELENIQIL